MLHNIDEMRQIALKLAAMDEQDIQKDLVCLFCEEYQEPFKEMVHLPTCIWIRAKLLKRAKLLRRIK